MRQRRESLGLWNSSKTREEAERSPAEAAWMGGPPSVWRTRCFTGRKEETRNRLQKSKTNFRLTGRRFKFVSVFLIVCGKLDITEACVWVVDWSVLRLNLLTWCCEEETSFTVEWCSLLLCLFPPFVPHFLNVWNVKTFYLNASLICRWLKQVYRCIDLNRINVNSLKECFHTFLDLSYHLEKWQSQW